MGTDGQQIVTRIATLKLAPQTKKKIVALARPEANDEAVLAAAPGSVGEPQPTAATFKTALAEMAS